MEHFALLMLFGVRVREVAALTEGSVWLPALRLLLIDSTLPASTRADLAESLLVEAADLP